MCSRMKLIILLLLLFITVNIYSFQHHLICVGDSITHGSGSSNISWTSYPARLQQILSRTINISDINNYGVKGSTAQRKSHNSFWNTGMYRDALNNHNVSTIIIQLGSNDAVYRIWNDSAFINDYKDLIKSFREKSPLALVFLCIPPPIYGQYAATKINTTVVNLLLPSIITDIGKDTGSHIIDLYTPLGGNGTRLTRPDYFVRDGVHPNDKGYLEIANVVATQVLRFLS